MKPANEYQVTFPYNSTTPPYTPSQPHRGNDRACPSGTPIIIGGQTIGLTGNTGISTGAHLHTQAGTDVLVQQTVNPSPYEFKEGTVVAVRTTDQGGWGKYIKMKVGSHYIVYAHLSVVNVKAGDIISDMPPFNDGDRKNLNFWLYGEDRLKFVGAIGLPYKDAIGGIFTSDEYKVDAFVNQGDVGNINTALGRDDANKVLSQTWKTAGYDYFMKVIPPSDVKVLPPGDYKVE